MRFSTIICVIIFGVIVLALLTSIMAVLTVLESRTKKKRGKREKREGFVDLALYSDKCDACERTKLTHPDGRHAGEACLLCPRARLLNLMHTPPP